MLVLVLASMGAGRHFYPATPAGTWARVFAVLSKDPPNLVTLIEKQVVLFNSDPHWAQTLGYNMMLELRSCLVVYT